MNLIWDSIPSQLATENKRFFFGHAVKGARSKDLEDSLQWLSDAGMVYKVSKAERIGIPLSSFLSNNLFKIYMMDVGILRYKAGVSAAHIMEDRLDPLFKGGMMENYIMCELTAYGHAGEGYWGSGNQAEVDFLLTTDSGIIPVEVKSKEKYRATSLKEYIDRYSPARAIVISSKDYGINGTVVTVPMYLIWILHQTTKSSYPVKVRCTGPVPEQRRRYIPCSSTPNMFRTSSWNSRSGTTPHGHGEPWPMLPSPQAWTPENGIPH